MVTDNHYRWDFIGLSTDEKPTPATSKKVTDGSTFYCSDNSKLYVWYKNQWYEKEATGGGGTSYTAGDGIDITNDTISVDTDVVQGKLTAGTGITISEDNEISAEGSGVNVVQTLGSSTTDVMSQNAVTSSIYTDADNRRRLAIGVGATTSGNYGITVGNSSSAAQSSIAIGSGLNVFGSANAYQPNSIAIGSGANTNSTHSIAIGGNAVINSNRSYSIALGDDANPTRSGELNVGTGTSTSGYNSTSYRVIGGVHDGQEANDAVTVGQVNSVIDAINTALSTNIPHIGA